MISHYRWEWSYYLQAMACMPCALAIFFAPSKYFDVEEALNYKQLLAEKYEHLHGEGRSSADFS